MVTLATTVHDDALTLSTNPAQASANSAAGVAHGTIQVGLTGSGPAGGGQNGGGQNEGGQKTRGGNGPVASGDDTGGNQCGYSDEHGGRPVPSFWNFVENEQRHEHFANNNHNQFDLMRHRA